MADPYRKVACWYDSFFEKQAGNLWQIGISFAPPQRGMAVLDVGCGTGAHLRRYREAGCRVVGIDLSPAMLAQARKRLGPAAYLAMADAARPPFAEKCFDRILFSFTLHEMPAETRFAAVKSAKAMLKEGGRLVMIDFHPGPLTGFKGRLVKSMILMIELAAGIRHFKNHLHFISNNGLSEIVAGNGLIVENRKIVGGGNLAVYLVRE